MSAEVARLPDKAANIENPTVKALRLLREPFPPEAISKLPKPTKAQTDAVKKNFKEGMRCTVCGGWHHKNVVHLDYVGHAALTDRLLKVDPFWNWEPLAFDEKGMPLIINGGMWIKLTVCGITRLGYGDAQGKADHNAIKEMIGDALRNAAMRFGCALDLWFKGESLFDDTEDTPDPTQDKTQEKHKPVNNKPQDRKYLEQWLEWVDQHTDLTLDTFLVGWEQSGKKAMAAMSPAHQQELQIAKKEMETYLREKETKQ